MRKLLSLVIGVLLCTPIFANAGFDETFSSPSDLETLWEYDDWNGANLDFSSGEGASFDGSNPGSGVQITSRQAMIGDFTAELVFDNFSTVKGGPWQETPNIGFTLIDEDGQETRMFFAETADSQGAKAERGFIVMGRFEACPNDSGSMIIQRAGNTGYLRYRDGDGPVQDLSQFPIRSDSVTIRASFFRGGENVTSYNATIKSINVTGVTDYPKNILKTDAWLSRTVTSEGRVTEFGVDVRNGLGQPYCVPATSVQAFYGATPVSNGEVFFEAWPYSKTNGRVLGTGEVVFDSPMKNEFVCTYGVLFDKNEDVRAGDYKIVIKRSDGGADFTSDFVELESSDAIDLPVVDHNTISALSNAGGFIWQLPANASLADHVDFEIEPTDEYGTSKWTRYRIRKIQKSQTSIVLPDDVLAQLKAASDYVRVRVRLRGPERTACSNSDRVLFKFDGNDRFVRTNIKKNKTAVVIPLF